MPSGEFLRVKADSRACSSRAGPPHDVAMRALLQQHRLVLSTAQSPARPCASRWCCSRTRTAFCRLKTQRSDFGGGRRRRQYRHPDAAAGPSTGREIATATRTSQAPRRSIGGIERAPRLRREGSRRSALTGSRSTEKPDVAIVVFGEGSPTLNFKATAKPSSSRRATSTSSNSCGDSNAIWAFPPFPCFCRAVRCGSIRRSTHPTPSLPHGFPGSEGEGFADVLMRAPRRNRTHYDF